LIWIKAIETREVGERKIGKEYTGAGAKEKRKVAHTSIIIVRFMTGSQNGKESTRKLIFPVFHAGNV